MRKPLVALLLLVAGCLQDAPQRDAPEPAAPSPLLVDRFPVELNHDHTQAALHQASLGIEPIGYTRTGLGDIPNAPVVNLGIARNTLVASLGSFTGAGALAPPMALLVADVSDLARPRVLSVTELAGGGVESVAISTDARFAFVGTEFSGSVGIWTIDLADRAAPKLLAFTPQPTEGPHNVRYGVIGQRHYVFASVSHVATWASATGQQDPLPLVDLRVDIFEFDPDRPASPMRLASSYQAQDMEGKGPTSLVHDAVLQVHPLTGQPLLYVAHWDRGVRIVDLSDPARPKEIGKYVDPTPTTFLTIHTVKPHPGLIEGRHVAVATGQCAYTPASTCHVRILDTTDPTQPMQIGTWTLPEDVHGAGYTTEIFDLDNGTIWMPWAHAGLWALDISNAAKLAAPEVLGYHFVAMPSQLRQGGSVPQTYAVVVKDGHAIVADMNTGIHVFRSSALR